MTSFYDADSYKMLPHGVILANFLFGDIPVHSGAVSATRCGTGKIGLDVLCDAGLFFRGVFWACFLLSVVSYLCSRM